MLRMPKTRKPYPLELTTGHREDGWYYSIIYFHRPGKWIGPFDTQETAISFGQDEMASWKNPQERETDRRDGPLPHSAETQNPPKRVIE